MPRTWRIFRMITYLHFALLAGFLLMVFYSIFRFTVHFNATDYLYFSLVMLSVTALIANSSINLYLLEKYYPDQLPSKKLRGWGVVLFIAALLVVLTDTILTVIISEEFWNSLNTQTLQGGLLLGIFAGVSITGFYILWKQVSLRKALRRNYEAAMENFLEQEQSPA